MKNRLLMFFVLLCNCSYSQSNIDTILRGGEIIINGLSFLKNNKNETKASDSKFIESICIKNKLSTTTAQPETERAASWPYGCRTWTIGVNALMLV